MIEEILVILLVIAIPLINVVGPAVSRRRHSRRLSQTFNSVLNTLENQVTSLGVERVGFRQGRRRGRAFTIIYVQGMGSEFHVRASGNDAESIEQAMGFAAFQLHTNVLNSRAYAHRVPPEPKFKESPHERGFKGATNQRREWWEILGVSRGASKREIRRAWKNLARTAHPDVGGAPGLMAEINAARDDGLKEFG